jgi:hypothetical protein
MRKVFIKKKIIISLKATVYVNITYNALLLNYNYIIDACFTSIHDALMDYSNFITYINTTNKL